MNPNRSTIGSIPCSTCPMCSARRIWGMSREQSYEAYFRSAFSNVLRFAAGDDSAVLNPAFIEKRKASLESS